ncbi:hypothetical protein J1614_000026 [Plenodomus biglobosus]|nr:hypothetical protein J1614_000026 [Plenodomus biglobosus]
MVDAEGTQAFSKLSSLDTPTPHSKSEPPTAPTHTSSALVRIAETYQTKISTPSVPKNTFATINTLEVRTFCKSAYRLEHTKTLLWDTHPFGDNYSAHKRTLAASRYWNDAQLVTFLRNEASARAINNTIYAEVERPKGKQAFFNLSHAQFCQALACITDALTNALQHLHGMLAIKTAMPLSNKPAGGLEIIVVGEEGRGHRAMMEDYQRR